MTGTGTSCRDRSNLARLVSAHPAEMIPRIHRIPAETPVITGDTQAGILEEFPFREADDVQACLLYAQQAVTREYEVNSVHETSSS